MQKKYCLRQKKWRFLQAGKIQSFFRYDKQVVEISKKISNRYLFRTVGRDNGYGKNIVGINPRIQRWRKEKIAEKMNPLIEFYARKLYTWDREDARQEMLLALFLSLEKMKYCRNEGEMLSYLKTGIRRRYKDLMLKELHNKEETVYAEWTEVQDERDDFAISEFYMNLESALESFHGKERKIAERILFYGESDTEAAIQEAVSRQYCNRIRKKFVRKM